ncbi:MAG: gamma carbonic anhydrase family protein [Oligoflexia bacterium]|nr:gamma carbonic anhydrase family protein [Oligoflexia bacterium]
MIANCFGKKPKLDATAWIAPTADVLGDVTMGAHSSIWFQAVARGDVHWIKIGEYTNVQDGSVLHVTNGRFPLTIGDRVTIGHKALLHGCTVGNDCLIGMGAILLDGVEVGDHCVVAAGALLPPGKKYPSGHLILGSPAKAVRALTESEKEEMIQQGWKNYHSYVAEYRKSFEIQQ